MKKAKKKKEIKYVYGSKLCAGFLKVNSLLLLLFFEFKILTTST